MNRNLFFKKANDNSLTGIKLYFCTKKVIQGDVRQKLGISQNGHLKKKEIMGQEEVAELKTMYSR